MTLERLKYLAEEYKKHSERRKGEARAKAETMYYVGMIKAYEMMLAHLEGITPDDTKRQR